MHSCTPGYRRGIGVVVGVAQNKKIFQIWQNDFNSKFVRNFDQGCQKVSELFSLFSLKNENMMVQKFLVFKARSKLCQMAEQNCLGSTAKVQKCPDGKF